MCVDMRADMCVDMCVDMRVDMCIDMCIDSCVDMRVDMCVDMCIDRCVGMCVGMSTDMPTHMPTHHQKALAEAVATTAKMSISRRPPNRLCLDDRQNVYFQTTAKMSTHTPGRVPRCVASHRFAFRLLSTDMSTGTPVGTSPSRGPVCGHACCGEFRSRVLLAESSRRGGDDCRHVCTHGCTHGCAHGCTHVWTHGLSVRATA